MKIVLDARIIYTSTGRYVERLIDHLQNIDGQNEYIVLLLKKDFDRWQPKNPNFHKVQTNANPYTFAEQFELAWQLYRLRPDLVHFTAPHYPLLYFKKRVVTVHDLTLIDYVNKRDEGPIKNLYKHHLKPAVFKLLMQITARSATHIITPTNYVRNELISRFKADPNRLTTTYEAAETMAIRPRAYQPLAGKTYLLYVGNAYPYKNLERLAKAFSLTNLPNTLLVFVGKSDYFYQQLQQYVSQQKLSDIMFTGFIEDDELAWVYNHAKAYAVPSLSEGFGLPGLEAMLHGLPLASSNATCLPEVYGNAALYFNPEDTDDMAAVITKLMGDSALQKKLKDAGLKRVASFSWRRTAEQTHSIYQQILKGR
jgi:glycosyltransferase involved in cell wall biosynthesis